MPQHNRKQTTRSGDMGENLVATAMDSIGVNYRRQPQRTGRGHRWKPDFSILRQGETSWSEEAKFVEVKAQFTYGSADAKIAGQALRAHRMGLKGYFVLLTHADRDMFSQDVIADTQWMLDQLNTGIVIIQGTDALIEALRADGYANDTPNTMTPKGKLIVQTRGY